jgi:MFS family permease
MIAPALPQIAAELGITSTVELQLSFSIFVLAYAIGPLFLGPLSEMYGRTRVLQFANLIYLAFNTACGFAKTKEQMIAFRFLSGFGGCAPLAVS